MSEYGLYEFLMDILGFAMITLTCFVVVVGSAVIIFVALPWFKSEWRTAFGSKQRKEVKERPKAKVTPIREGTFIYNKHRRLVKLGGVKAARK
jgi:hypothetical protein